MGFSNRSAILIPFLPCRHNSIRVWLLSSQGVITTKWIKTKFNMTYLAALPIERSGPIKSPCSLTASLATSRIVKERGLNLSQWRVLAAIAAVPVAPR